MRNNLFLLTLISAHFIGDFYLQSNTMAILKKDSFFISLKHAVYYSVPFLFLPLLFEKSLGVVLLSMGLHFLIDLFKFKLEKNKKEGNTILGLKPKFIYLIDQGIHFLSLIFIGTISVATLRVSILIESLNLPVFIVILPGILFLFKPANITFKIIFGEYAPLEKENNSVQGAGAVIGSLERILMLIFLGLNQFAAVGLIMTAKSIARYDKISKDPVFAEYYLIGTLYSILVTVIIYILFLF